MRALIGHTGFVGSNLLAEGGFGALFNSRNIHEMRGRSFDEVVCAGVAAVKWQANKEPEADWAGIRALLDVLDTVQAKQFTLISTIDVYPDPAAGLDEGAMLEGVANHAYGRHRLAMEQHLAARFPNLLVARLPALFGPGLRKNIIFDLLQDRLLAQINPASVFQWYPLSRLGSDLRRARSLDLPLVNLFPEPLATADILAACFPGATVGPAQRPAPRYDTHTRHGAAFGGPPDYIAEAGAVMEALGSFIRAARAP